MSSSLGGNFLLHQARPDLPLRNAAGPQLRQRGDFLFDNAAALQLSERGGLPHLPPEVSQLHQRGGLSEMVHPDDPERSGLEESSCMSLCRAWISSGARADIQGPLPMA